MRRFVINLLGTFIVSRRFALAFLALGSAHLADGAIIPPVDAPALDPYRRTAVSNLLTLEARHSVDFQAMDGVISDEEIALTIALWQAEDYHRDPGAELGYGPGSGSQQGIPLSADIREPYWSLDTVELNRQLATWRAGRYQEQPDAPEEFVPLWQHPYSASTSQTFTAILYVDQANTNPTPPYTSPATAARTLQAAVDIAPSGSVIRVAPGWYTEGSASTTLGDARMVITKAITVESTHGAAETLIVGQASPPIRGVILNHPAATLRGFTITHGQSPGSASTQTHRSGGGLLGLALREVSDCHITASSALPNGHGGGMALFSVSGLVQRVNFSHNQAFQGGGAAILWGNLTRMDQTVLHHNTATISGGGITIDNSQSVRNLLAHHNQAGQSGGGVTLNNNAVLWNATIVDNEAPSAGGLLLSGNNTRAVNTIAFFNANDDVNAASGFTGMRIDHICSPPIFHPAITISNHIHSTPAFINPVLHDYRIRDPQSPTLNAGLFVPWMAFVTDLDGAPRIHGTTPDLGAYERVGPQFAAATPDSVTLGESFTLTFDITRPEDLALGALSFELDLPEAWEITQVSGLSEPAARSNHIVFLGAATSSLISATVTVQTALAEEAPPVTIHPRIHWQWFGMTETLEETGDAIAISTLPPPTLFTVQTLVGEGGTITPAHIYLEPGGQAELLVTAYPFYRIEDITLNGVSQDAVGGLLEVPIIVPDLQFDLTVSASFVADTTDYGVPLAWLDAYGLTNQVPELEILDDPDDDGLPTWMEFIAGTSPIDPSDTLVLTDMESPTGAPTLLWPSQTGRVYTLYHTLSLDPPTWIPVASDIPASPPMNSYPLPVDLDQGFFRIDVELAP